MVIEKELGKPKDLEKVIGEEPTSEGISTRTYPPVASNEYVGEALKMVALEEKQKNIPSNSYRKRPTGKLRSLSEKLALDKLVPMLIGIYSAKKYIDYRIDSLSQESIIKFSEAAEKFYAMPLSIKITAEGAAFGILCAAVTYALIKYAPNFIAPYKAGHQ